MGKVIIVHVLYLSKLIYNFSPDYVIVRIEKLITNFIWPSKLRINRNCVINAIENGGINLKKNTIFENYLAFKMAYIPFLDASCQWIFIVLITSCIQMNMHNHVENILPLFYKDVLNYLYFCKQSNLLSNMNKYDILSSVIWGNNILVFRQWVFVCEGSFWWFG